MIQRPKSLQEIPNHCSNFEEFGMSCRDFIGKWNHAPRPRGAMLTEEPRLLAKDLPEGAICDAFLAGMAEYFAEREGVPVPPWANEPVRFLSEEWCSEPPGEMRELYRRETPASFIKRRLVISVRALDRL
jgi:hypothetical protein